MLIIAFLGTTASRLMRVGSAFAVFGEGWGFLAFLAATFALGRLLSSFLGGELTKRFGARVTSFGLFMLGLVGLGYAYLPSTYYLPLRVVHGLSAGFTWPSLQAVTMSKVEEKKRGRASSLYFVATNLGWFFAFTLGGLLSKRALLPSALALLILSLATLKVKGKVRKGEGRKRRKAKIFAPPTGALVLSALALGFMTVMVNTEVAIAAFGFELGKALAGITLGLAALIGSGISYFLNKKLIDVMESHLSMLLPALTTSLSGFLISAPPPLSVIGLVATKTLTMWWRSAVLGLARTGDVGRRVGAFNAGGDAGRLIGSSISSLGPWTLLLLPALALALGVGAWAWALKGAESTFGMEARPTRR